MRLSQTSTPSNTPSHRERTAPSAPPCTLVVFLSPPVCKMRFFFFFLMIRRPPRSPLFPSTTLFRSRADQWLDASCRCLRGKQRRQLHGGHQIGRAHLNSSHTIISYAVFCLKKKKPTQVHPRAPALGCLGAHGKRTAGVSVLAWPRQPTAARRSPFSCQCFTQAAAMQSAVARLRPSRPPSPRAS